MQLDWLKKIRRQMNKKLPYEGSFYNRFGPLIVKRGIIAIPKALWDFRRELGINGQHIDVWGAISAKYRSGNEIRLKYSWLAEATNKKPGTVRKLMKELEKKGLIRITKLSHSKYLLDLSPTTNKLMGLLTECIKPKVPP